MEGVSVKFDEGFDEFGPLIKCTCAEQHGCPEDYEENHCLWCQENLQPDMPCPTVGFGCGKGPYPPCDCCTPEQREAATP